VYELGLLHDPRGLEAEVAENDQIVNRNQRVRVFVAFALGVHILTGHQGQGRRLHSRTE
jgi:hypothetical protein